MAKVAEAEQVLRDLETEQRTLLDEYVAAAVATGARARGWQLQSPLHFYDHDLAGRIRVSPNGGSNEVGNFFIFFVSQHSINQPLR